MCMLTFISKPITRYFVYPSIYIALECEEWYTIGIALYTYLKAYSDNFEIDNTIVLLLYMRNHVCEAGSPAECTNAIMFVRMVSQSQARRGNGNRK